MQGDFARFGMMFKNKGVYANKQLLPESFTELATKPRFPNDDMYGYGFGSQTIWISTSLP